MKSKKFLFIVIVCVVFFGTFSFADDSRANNECTDSACENYPYNCDVEHDKCCLCFSGVNENEHGKMPVVMTVGVERADWDTCRQTCINSQRADATATFLTYGGLEFKGYIPISEVPPVVTTPSTTTTNAGGVSFTNPLTFSTVEDFLGGIMSAIQKIIVVLALVFIMIGAVMILASAGNSGMVEKGKESITMALVGLALGVAAPSLLKELSSIIGWGPGAAGAGLTLSEIAVRVLNFLLGTMGILALIMLVIGAILYLTSAGDEDQIDKGKEIFKWSLIGVLMAMASMVLVKQIAQFFV